MCQSTQQPLTAEKNFPRQALEQRAWQACRLNFFLQSYHNSPKSPLIPNGKVALPTSQVVRHLKKTREILKVPQIEMPSKPQIIKQWRNSQERLVRDILANKTALDVGPTRDLMPSHSSCIVAIRMRLRNPKLPQLGKLKN